MSKPVKEKIYTVAIVGRSNVGKSSLFNRIVGSKLAVVLDEPKTTRDSIEEIVNINGKTLKLVDTAGHFKGKGTEIENKSIQKIKEALKESDSFIFTVDGETLPTEEDVFFAEILRKTGKRVFLAINKIDSPKKKTHSELYKKLGFKEIHHISAIHNIGIESLLESVTKDAPKQKISIKKERPLKIVIIGRPNVGKSSILNAICGRERTIVSDVPGTTRDVITEKINTENLEIEVTDTAGVRRPGKIGKAYKKGQPIEKYAYLRTEKSIKNSDIVLLVLDASENKATTQELHIAGIAKEAGKGIILVINKWDLTKDIYQEKFLRHLRRRFSFMTWVPAIFVSAKTNLNINNLPKIIETVRENQNRTISTSKLNRIIEDFAISNLPKGQKGLKPKLYFAAQTGVVPPTFEISAKHFQFIHFSWERALKNRLRELYDFSGTPIKIIFKSKRN